MLNLAVQTGHSGVVMLSFTVLELLRAAYASVFWWKQVYSNNPEGIQILLAFITVGLGIVLAFGYVSFSEIFPLVFLSGYPFWGAFIFFLTGSVTVINEKFKNIQFRGITAMNVISSVVAMIGIALILISFTQQHKFCQMLSLEGSCGLGRTFFLGILSILLIIAIAELGISVTIASFRSHCWTSSDEVVFFLPSDVTPNREQPVPEENTVLQFKPQEESSRNNKTSDQQTVFIGGYSFLKLRVLRSPLVHRCMLPTCNICKDGNYTSPAPIPEEEIEQKPLQALPAPDLPSEASLIKAPPVQAMLYATPTSHISQSLDLTSEDLPSQDVLIPEKPSQDTLFQETTSAQVTSEDIEATPSYSMQYPKIPHISQDLQPPNQQSPEIVYSDIQTEVIKQTQEWKSQDRHPRRMLSLFYRKYPKRFSLETRESEQSPRRHSLDLQSKRRKSLDQKIKAWLLAKKQSPSKQTRYTQTEQLAEDLQTKEKQSPKEQSKDREDKEEQIIKEQFPKKQTQDKQAEDHQAQEEKSPKEQSQKWQAKGPQFQVKKALKQMCQDWDLSSEEHKEEQFSPKQSLQWTKQNWSSFNQQSEDWRSQDWRHKDWIARDWQSEMQHALNRNTLDLLERESLRQKALYQEVPTQNTMAQYNLGRQFQNNDPKELQSKIVPKEDKQIRNIKQGKPIHLQLEDMNPDFQPSSSQSLVQDTYLTCLSNIDSEQEVHPYASASSNSYRDLNVTSSSGCSKDQQVSEDSD